MVVSHETVQGFVPKIVDSGDFWGDDDALVIFHKLAPLYIVADGLACSTDIFHIACGIDIIHSYPPYALGLIGQPRGYRESAFRIAPVEVAQTGLGTGCGTD